MHIPSIEHKQKSQICSLMKISRGNTTSQIVKTFWRYCYAISSSIPHSIYTLPHIKDSTT